VLPRGVIQQTQPIQRRLAEREEDSWV
jgi:hypothetical protein